MCTAGDWVCNCRLFPDGLHRCYNGTMDLGSDRPPLGPSSVVSAACVARGDLQSPSVAGLGDPAHQRPQTQVCKITMLDKCTFRRRCNTVQQGTHKASPPQPCAPSNLYISCLQCCMSAENGCIIQPQAPGKDNRVSTLTEQSHIPSLTPANPLGSCLCSGIHIAAFTSIKKAARHTST